MSNTIDAFKAYHRGEDKESVYTDEQLVDIAEELIGIDFPDGEYLSLKDHIDERELNITWADYCRIADCILLSAQYNETKRRKALFGSLYDKLHKK